MAPTTARDAAVLSALALVGIALVAALLRPTPRGAHVIPAAASGQPSLGHSGEPDLGRPWASAGPATAGTRALPSPPVSPTPVVAAAHRRLTGEASWGWFSGHVVTRLARGTLIRVCGALGCWPSATGWGRSWGYGPARWTGRIADLDRSVFAAICGDPRRGVCQVVLAWR